MSHLKLPKHLRTGNENQARSRVQERGIAKATGGKLVRGSGAGREKGDVRKYKVFRCEAKITIHKSFSVTQDLIEKLEASVPGGLDEVPFLQIDINSGAQKVAVFPIWALPLILEALEGKAGE